MVSENALKKLSPDVAAVKTPSAQRDAIPLPRVGSGLDLKKPAAYIVDVARPDGYSLIGVA